MWYLRAMSRLAVVHEGVTLVGDVTGEGPTLLLLHGWPDTSALWREVTPHLVAEGYRVVTVDLRGCGASDKPRDVAAYAMTHLVGDVAAVLDALGGAPVTLVGHDWGASLAWVVAAWHPELVERLVVLSVGHPSAFRAAGVAQQARSWYALLFAQEGLGERFLRHHDYDAMRHWLGHPRVEEIIAELERDGQMTTHLLWYRANLPPDAFLRDAPTLPPIVAPTRGLWSSGDVALTEGQMIDSAPYCANGFIYRRLEGLGHWMAIEDPGRVAEEIVAGSPSRGRKH